MPSTALQRAQYAHDHAYSNDSPRSEREAARAYDAAWDSAYAARKYLDYALVDLAEKDHEYAGASLLAHKIEVTARVDEDSTAPNLSVTLGLHNVRVDDPPKSVRLWLADALRELAADIERA